MAEKGRGSRGNSQSYPRWRTGMTEYDEMANKHVITDKELAKVKRSSKSKINTDKEVIDTLKKERDSFRKKMEAKKEKNRLAKIDIKEERKIQSQYMA